MAHAIILKLITIDLESEACDKHWDSGEKVKGSDLREIRQYPYWMSFARPQCM